MFEEQVTKLHDDYAEFFAKLNIDFYLDVLKV